MPTPEGLNTTTLHGLYVEPNATGTPLQGSLSFTPNPGFVLFPAEDCIVAGTETATLDVNGEFSIELVSTDNAGSNPTGWLYTVTEKIIGQKQRTYNIALPYTSGVVVELADIQPSDAAPTYIPVVGPQGPPGVITTINGYSAATVTLTAADVGAIATTARGAANGVASLDASTKVPVAQIPDLTAAYVPWANVEVANGVASLDSSAKIKSTELNLAASAPPSVGTGAVGTSTNLARQDHTHDGLALTGTQSASGAKNFTTSLQTALLSVGVAPGTGGTRANITSTVDETTLLLSNTTVTMSNPLVNAVGFDTATTGFSTRVSGDTVGRLAIKTSGNIEFGSGSGARDTTLSRSAANELTASGQLVLTTAAPTAIGHATRKDYVDGNFVGLTNTQTISGVKTFTAAPFFQAGSAGTVVTNYRVTGDTTPRQTVGADGTISWGPGNAAADVTLSRTSGASLSNSSNYQSSRATNLLTAFTALVTGDTFDRWRAYSDGKQEWGTGAAARDTNLYRSGVGVLTTDTNLVVAGGALTLGSAIKKTSLGSATTVANTTTETVIATISVAAGELVVGASYRIKVHAIVSFLASATLTWKLRWGGVSGTNVGTTGPTTLSSTAQTNKEVFLEGYAQVRTVAASGGLFANLLEIRNTTQTGSIGEIQMGSSDGVVTVDTSSATTFVVTAQWGAASASNTLSAYATMERLS